MNGPFLARGPTASDTTKKIGRYEDRGRLVAQAARHPLITVLIVTLNDSCNGTEEVSSA